MERRIGALEGKKQSDSQVKRMVRHYTVSPEDVEFGHMAYVGKYKSKNGMIGSTFGDDYVQIDKLFQCNSFEMAKVIDAFSSEERIDIIKQLIEEDLSAKELMDRLEFKSTGKLYHHLSFLEKIGVLKKTTDRYQISGKYINCIILIFTGVSKIISKNNER